MMIAPVRYRDRASIDGVQRLWRLCCRFVQHIFGAFGGRSALGVCRLCSELCVPAKEAIVYLIIIAFLLFRPEGLFGRTRAMACRWGLTMPTKTRM